MQQLTLYGKVLLYPLYKLREGWSLWQNWGSFSSFPPWSPASSYPEHLLSDLKQWGLSTGVRRGIQLITGTRRIVVGSAEGGGKMCGVHWGEIDAYKETVELMIILKTTVVRFISPHFRWDHLAWFRFLFQYKMNQSWNIPFSPLTMVSAWCRWSCVNCS